jgi:hypothetical protein
MSADQWLRSYAVERLGALGKDPPACKVCGAQTFLFDVLDFGRQCNVVPYPDGVSGIPVYYFRCQACGLLFTDFFDRFESSHWSTYVYNAGYARVDPEYGGARARTNAELVKAAIRGRWPAGSLGCDYGGGSGAMADLLGRDGLDFDSFDPFGRQDLRAGDHAYWLVSAFEVLEHVPDPQPTFARMTALLADGEAMMLVSTAVSDSVQRSGQLSSWWYAAPRNGHITLFSGASLQHLAKTHDLEYRKVTRGLHVFGRGINLAGAVRALLIEKLAQRLWRH